MITADDFELHDIVEFSSPLIDPHRGAWLVSSIGIDWADIINGKGNNFHFGRGNMRRHILDQDVVYFNRLRSVSRLDKLLLFYNHFYGEQPS